VDSGDSRTWESAAELEGEVINRAGGNISGNVLQARDIGNVTFVAPPTAELPTVQYRAVVCVLGADRTWAQWIAAVLRGAGYATTRQDWLFMAGENLVQHAADLLAGDARILLTFSQSSVGSPFYQQFGSVLLGDPHGRERAAVLRVEGAALPVEFGVTADASLHGDFDDREARDYLLARLGELGWPMEPVPDRYVPEGYPGRGPEVSNLQPRNLRFTDRNELLERIGAHLLGERPTPERSSGCVLWGIGGVGKSQTAYEYAHRFRSSYRIIWIVYAERPPDVPDNLRQLATALGVPSSSSAGDVLVSLRRALRERGRWLIIFDNVTDSDVVRNNWPGDGGNVLVTTTRANDIRKLAMHDFPLEPLSENDALTLLRKGTEQVDDADATALRAISEELGYLPLALSQAAGYMESTQVTPAEYLELIRAELPEMMAEADSHDENVQTVAKTLDVALRRVRDEEPGAEQLLIACAFLAADQIPRSLFPEHAEVLPTELSAVVSSGRLYNSAIRALRGYSLLGVTEQFLMVHRLVQAITLRACEHQYPDSERVWATAMVRLLDRAFPTDPHDIAAWPACATLAPHLLAVRRFAGDTDAGSQLAALLYRCGQYLDHRNEHAQAIELYQQAGGILGDEPSDELADVLVGLGWSHFLHARLGPAREGIQRSLAISTELHGDDDGAVLEPLSRLGSVLLETSELDDAAAVLTKAREIASTHDGDAMLGRIAATLGQVRYRQGRLADAQAEYSAALAVLARTGIRDELLASTYRRLALVQTELGELADALANLARSREISVELNGDGSMEAARADVASAIALLRNDELAEAEQYVTKGLRVLDEWGPEHSNTAEALQVYGDVLAATGHTDEAMQRYERARQIHAKLHGPDHPYTAKLRRRIEELDRDRR
jgi:tetratricopeptide (TPR) repeat protein